MAKTKKKTRKSPIPAKPLKEKSKNRNLYIFILLSIIILITFFKVYSFVYNKKIDISGDSAGYYILANALANGDGYTNVQYVAHSPANHFPPGYPFILSIFIKVLSNKIPTLIAVNGFFLLLSSFLLFYLFYKLSKNIYLAFTVIILSFFNFFILRNATMIMSEMSFLFFTVIAILLYLKIDFNKPFYKNLLFLFLILTVTIAYYIRTIGIATIISIAFMILIQKRWKYLLAFCSSFILLVLPWIIRGQQLGGNSYINQLFQVNPYRPELGSMQIGDWIPRFLENFQRYITREIPSACLSKVQIQYRDPIQTSEWLIGIVLIIFIAFGIYKLAQYRKFILVFFLINFSILLLWPPIWNGTRFMLPLIPFFLFLIVFGTYNLVMWLLSKIRLNQFKVVQFGLPLGFLFTIPTFLPNVQLLHENAIHDYLPMYKNYFDIGVWASKNTEKDALICCRKPELFYLFSGRHVINFKNTLNREEEIQFLIENKVDYVVLDQLGYSSTGRYLYPTIMKYPEKFQEVHRIENPNTFIIKFRPELGYWGQWKNNKREGKGKYAWENGIRFEGDWKNDLRNGKGIQYYPNGMKLEGNWINDQLNGFADLYDKNGNFLERRHYQNDKVID